MMQLWRPQEEGGVELLYNSVKTGSQLVWRPDPLVTRCRRESQYPEKLGLQAPGRAAQENGKEMHLWPIEWGSICYSSVRSPSYTQPFQLKLEVYFSKELCRSSSLCCYDYVLCACIAGHGYECTTSPTMVDMT